MWMKLNLPQLLFSAGVNIDIVKNVGMEMKMSLTKTLT
jgi:hypothetical protein